MLREIGLLSRCLCLQKRTTAIVYVDKSNRELKEKLVTKPLVHHAFRKGTIGTKLVEKSNNSLVSINHIVSH